MSKMFVITVSLAMSLLVAFTRGQDCELSQEALTKSAMECVAHDPSLMLQIIEHMEHPDTMANMKFVCSNQKDLVDVAMCMEKKLVVCLPKETQPLVQKFVTRGKLQALLQFACQHQAALMDNCLDAQSTAQLSQCMQSRAQSLAASLISSALTSASVNNFVCRFDAVFTDCLEAHRGTCSNAYLSIYEQMFKMMLPASDCRGVAMDIKNGAAGQLLGSLLLHGAPMDASKTGAGKKSNPLFFKRTGKLGPAYKFDQP